MSKKKEEKSEIKELKEQLFTRTDKGIASMKESEIKKADKYCEDYKKFIDHSKTEREAVKTAVKLAEKAGFVPFEQDKKYKAGDRIYYVNRHKALALAVIGKKGVKDGVRLAIAHIDSPFLSHFTVLLLKQTEQRLKSTWEKRTTSHASALQTFFPTLQRNRFRSLWLRCSQVRN